MLPTLLPSIELALNDGPFQEPGGNPAGNPSGNWKEVSERLPKASSRLSEPLPVAPALSWVPPADVTPKPVLEPEWLVTAISYCCRWNLDAQSMAATAEGDSTSRG
jgi:hypothetical protein